MIRVLISGAGTATCQGVIKGLSKVKAGLDMEIHTMDTNRLSAGRFLSDKFHAVPPASDDSFIPALNEIIKKERIDILFPIVDYEFEKLALAVPQFDRLGCRVIISGQDTIATCVDKMRTYEYFTKLSIPTPETALLSEENLRGVCYPQIAKPRKGRASIDVFKIENEGKLKALIEEGYKDMIIQRFVPGMECTIDFVCDFNGLLLAMVPRYRMEVKSGVSYKGKTFHDGQLTEYVERIVGNLNFAGAGNIQCIKGERGYEFTEINPRFSGGLPLSIEAGMNSPAMLVDLFLGKRINPSVGSYRAGLCMMRYWEEVFVHEDNI